MKTKSSPGFTLLELIVVVGVIGVLLGVLAPALAKTKPVSYAAQCLNNLRQLTASWQMYSDDNFGGLVYNTDGIGTGKNAGHSLANLYNAGWVGGWLDFSASLDNTNICFLVRHDPTVAGDYFFCGYLGPYIKSPGAFKCPADKSLAPISGQALPRVRSYSMNNYVGAETRTWLGSHAGAGVTLGIRQGGSAYPILEKYSSIRSPEKTFILLEEHEGSINDDCFFSDPDFPYQLIDYPAARHDWAGTLSFADGHAEIHRWRDARTVPVLQPGQLLPLNVNLPGDVDVVWLVNRAVGKP